MYLNYPENYVQLCKKNVYRDIDAEELVEIEEDEICDDDIEEFENESRSYDDDIENDVEYENDDYINDEEYISDEFDDEFMERGCVDVKCMCKKMHKEIKGMGDEIMDDMKSLKSKMMKEKASLTKMMKELMVMQKELMVMLGSEVKKSCEKEEVKKASCTEKVEEKKSCEKPIMIKKEKCTKPVMMKEEGCIKKVDKKEFKDIDEEYILKCESKRGERRGHSKNRKSK